MIFIYSPSASLLSSGRFPWNSPKPSLVLTNWNNCVSFHFITCPLLWIVNAADSCETFAMHKINQFVSYEKKLQQVQTNLTEAINSITALRSPPSPFAGGSCPTQSWQKGAHTQAPAAPTRDSGRELKIQGSSVCMNPQDTDTRKDEMQAHSPFGKCCCRSGNPQGEEADNWDKRKYCKAAVAFFLWSLLWDAVSQSGLMIQANLKLHQQWKGSLTLIQHVVLPKINTEGIWQKMKHANNNKKPEQKHPLFSEESLNDPSTDKH